MLMDVENLLFDEGNTDSVDFERYTKMAMRDLPDNPFFLSRNWNIRCGTKENYTVDLSLKLSVVSYHYKISDRKIAENVEFFI